MPSLLAVLLEQLPPDEGAPPALRWLIPTGEALPVQTARQWLERFPSIPMMNAYGPTECSDDVTHHVLDRPPPSDQATVPIGSPVANMRMYVLDGRLEPLPAGATGELWVGGIGVGRGYLGDPARTAEVFVPDPFGPSPGARLYRTGDRGRWRHDGALEFLGRGDGQIKLRGFRIELGEIESALGRHPGVREAVVVAHAGGGDAQLIAHCVARSGATLTAADIQAWLRRSLPEYMVPALVSFLPALPLTPNGKVDRRALPVPRAEPPARDDLDEPATDTERRLASLWCALLDRHRVGRRHNFFDLGGHSLLAVRLQGRIEAELGARPPLHDILVARDLAALAAAVEAARSLPGPRLAAGIDLHRDALLDESVAPAAPAPAALDGLALLTGATGFVGAFALAELMERTGLAALCLVRADSADEALRRLRENLSRYGLWQERWASRVHVLVGDLARPRLGLSDRQWQRAAAETAVIFHAGALVNYAYDYPALAPGNVAGTRALLELACARRTKPVHHVSTIDVLGAPAEQVTFLEDAPSGRPEVLDTGYAQSKWVAEQLALAARARGLPVTIYRPGSVSGSSATGAANPDDANTRVLLASLALGVLPEMDTLIDLTPVQLREPRAGHPRARPGRGRRGVSPGQSAARAVVHDRESGARGRLRAAPPALARVAGAHDGDRPGPAALRGSRGVPRHAALRLPQHPGATRGDRRRLPRHRRAADPDLRGRAGVGRPARARPLIDRARSASVDAGAEDIHVALLTVSQLEDPDQATPAGEAGLLEQRQAGQVVGEHDGDQALDPERGGARARLVDQAPPQPLPSVVRVHVDADLGDSRIGRVLVRRLQAEPAAHVDPLPDHQQRTAVRVVRGEELVEIALLHRQRQGHARLHAGLIDGGDGGKIARGGVADHHDWPAWFVVSGRARGGSVR